MTLVPMPSPRPFWKSAGGKSQLLEELRQHVPPTFGRFFEPFVGGAALFFDLRARGIETPATLGDANPHLMNAYEAVRNSVEGTIAMLQLLKGQHSESTYYDVRDQFNAGNAGNRCERAARTMYLNKTCYCGLWRVNKGGGFNVPMGRYENPGIVDPENLRACSAALQSACLRCADFSEIVKSAVAGDFVYFDPPYVPKGGYADFTEYTPGGFTEADQIRLRNCALMLKERGVHVLLSNSDTPLVQELYPLNQFRARSVLARRNINSKASQRGTVGELLIW